jgi:hypothetical protein
MSGTTMRGIDRDRALWRNEAWILVGTGLLWLGWGGGASWIATAMAAIPGLLLVASGVSNLLWPGDPRQRHFGALGALAGILVGLISALWLGVAGALLMIALSAASGWAIGSLGLRLVERWEDVPEPLASVRAAFEVAVDSAVLAQMALRAPARGMCGNNERVAGEVHAALEMYRERGWVETPAAYHVTPPPLEKPELRRRRARGVDFEHLQFESGYEPHDGEPCKTCGCCAAKTSMDWRFQEASVSLFICATGRRRELAARSSPMFGEILKSFTSRGSQLAQSALHRHCLRECSVIMESH